MGSDLKITKSNNNVALQSANHKAVEAQLSKPEFKIIQWKSSDVEKPNVQINGKIEDFKQGKTGDCWLLSGLKSLADTKEGARAIKDSIFQDTDGNVHVTLQGVNETYAFSPKEIVDAKERLSTGDDDARVIELAVEAHRKQLLDRGIKREDHIEHFNRELGSRVGNGSNESPLKSGFSSEIFFLLTGKDNFDYFIQAPIQKEETLAYRIKKFLFRSPQKPPTLEKENNISMSNDNIRTDLNSYLTLMQKNSGKYACSVGFQEDHGISGHAIVDRHSYTVESIDNNYVTIVDPHNSSKKINITRNDFISNYRHIILFNTETQ